MTVRILPLPKWQFTTADGSPANGYYVYTYEPGTTTPKDTYSDSAGTIANTNPIVLDSRGEATIYWDGIYKVSIYDGDKDVSGVLIYEEDDYGISLEVPTIGNYNKAVNGDFETATADPTLPDDWTITEYTNGTVAIDTTTQFSGLNSLKFVSTGSGGGYATSNFFEVEEGKNLALNWAMKSSVADVRNVVEVIWYTSGQAQISTSSIYDDSTTNPTSWTRKISKATPPSTARYAKIRITGCHSSDSTVGNTWFDNIIAAQHADGDGSSLDADLLKSVDISLAQATAIATVPSANFDSIADLSSAEVDAIDASKNAATGFTYSNIIMIDDDGDSQGNNSFDISAIGATWETVGPTGAATNTWTALDNLPTTAKFIICKIHVFDTTNSHLIYARKNGSGVSTGVQTMIAYHNSASSGGRFFNNGIIIPLDGSNIFELIRNANSCNLADLYLIGYGV